ncbi:Uma2 family endonuclease [Roseisolibacter agri]|nr:Uma2 family endonuclease [Roseisolibacter agri]
MSTPTAPGPRRWTADEARALQDESRPWPRYECIDGALLVTPAPRPAHYYAQMALYERVRAYVHAQRLGEAYVPPTDVTLEPDTTVQPDLYVVPDWPPRRLRAWSDITTLLLAVEVLSPSTARHDRLVKRRFYARMGVPEYWIVDTDTRLVERSYPDGRVAVVGDRLEWLPPGTTEPFVLELEQFFADALGDDDMPNPEGELQ